MEYRIRSMWALLLQALPLLFLLSTAFSLPIQTPNKQFEVRRLLARGAKKRLDFCEKELSVPGFKYPSSSVLVKNFAKEGLTLGIYAPTNWARDTAFDFGTIKKLEMAGDSRHFASEHILEYQLLVSEKGFLGELDQLVDPSDTSKKPYGEKEFPDPRNNGGTLKFCDFMKTYWADTANKMSIHGITNTPINIVSLSIPNTDHFQEQLVLLDKNTNEIKSKLISPAVKFIRDDKAEKDKLDDPNLAPRVFFDIKHTIFAIKYMLDDGVRAKFIAQANQVADAWDKAEDNLALKYKSYTRQNFGDAWRVFVTKKMQNAFSKAFVFLSEWAPKFVNKYKEADTAEFSWPVGQDMKRIFDAIPSKKAKSKEDEDLIDGEVIGDEKDSDYDANGLSEIPPWSPFSPNKLATQKGHQIPDQPPSPGSESDPGSGGEMESPTRRLGGQRGGSLAPAQQDKGGGFAPAQPGIPARPGGGSAPAQPGGGSAPARPGGGSAPAQPGEQGNPAAQSDKMPPPPKPVAPPQSPQPPNRNPSDAAKRPLELSPGASPGGGPKKKPSFTNEPPSSANEANRIPIPPKTPDQPTISKPPGKDKVAGPLIALVDALRNPELDFDAKESADTVRKLEWYWLQPPLRSSQVKGSPGTVVVPMRGGRARQASPGRQI